MSEIIQTLRDMNMFKHSAKTGYSPAYTRTDLADRLHETAGFRTDYEMRPTLLHVSPIKKCNVKLYVNCFGKCIRRRFLSTVCCFDLLHLRSVSVNHEVIRSCRVYVE